MKKNYTYITDKEEMEKYKGRYEYVVFKDEIGEILVINARAEKDCMFAGMIGEIKELERGVILKPEEGNYLGALFNKKHEYEQMQHTRKEDKLNYQLLYGLRSECDYYLRMGDKDIKNLRLENVQAQIDKMKELYNSFANDKKPKWLSYEQILHLEKLMTINVSGCSNSENVVKHVREEKYEQTYLVI